MRQRKIFALEIVVFETNFCLAAACLPQRWRIFAVHSLRTSERTEESSGCVLQCKPVCDSRTLCELLPLSLSRSLSFPSLTVLGKQPRSVSGRMHAQDYAAGITGWRNTFWPAERLALFSECHSNSNRPRSGPSGSLQSNTLSGGFLM